jgi:hypothetical protein
MPGDAAMAWKTADASVRRDDNLTGTVMLRRFGEPANLRERFCGNSAILEDHSQTLHHDHIDHDGI